MTIIQKAQSVLQNPRGEVKNLLMAVPITRQVTLSGEFYHTPPNMHPLDRFNLFVGRYERDERDLLSDYFEPADIIIEIGSNFGFMARHAFPRLNEGGLYVCVEPNPVPQNALRKNMEATKKRHPCRDYTIISAAVCGRDADKAGFAVKCNLSSALVGHTRTQEDAQQIVDVPLLSLNSLVRQFAQEGKKVSLICDAEGAEISMLAENGDAFRAFQDISIELHDPKLTGSDVTPKDMIMAIQALGFELMPNDREGACRLFRRLGSLNSQRGADFIMDVGGPV